MKRFFYYLIFVAAVSVMACSKKIDSVKLLEEEGDVAVDESSIKEPNKIVFGVSIDLGDNVAPANADTKASLSSLDIRWTGGETIFIANNVNDEIEKCILTKDALVPTKGTISITEVAGATTYYAMFTSGTDNSDGKVVFDHSTATFSGSEVVCRQTEFTVSAPHRTDLAMAGKTDGGSITMQPCLALVKFQIHNDSVAAEYVDGSGYSSVRGFNLIMRHSDSRTNNCGTYSVNLSGSEMVVSSVGEGAKNYKQISSGSRLAASTDYYFSVIPVGAVEKIDLQFLGFKWNAETEKYDTTWGSDAKDYQMSLVQSLSFDSGDYFNFGTLNPVGLQKAKDAFVPAITIDGNMSDWDSVTNSGGPKGKYDLCKVTYDEYNMYFYCKTTGIDWNSSNYFYFCLDTDNNNTTGGDLWSRPGFETIFYISPFSGAEGTFNASPSINRTYPSSVSANAGCAGTWNSETKTAIFELKVSRSAIQVLKGNNIKLWTYAANASDGYFYFEDTIPITK